MPVHTFYRSAAALTLAALTVTSVSACRDESAEVPAISFTPIVAGEASSVALAPAVQALPAASKRVTVTRAAPSQPVYRYVEAAYALDEAFGDAPPDYGFDYGGVQPWVWRSAGDAWRMVEPTAHGERYYFYQPGRDEPYLVRDHDYAYAYDDGRLVNIYGRSGRVLDHYEAERRADWASRYYSRAREMRQAAERDRREQIAAANWQRRQARIEADRRAWAQERRRVAAWRAYQDRQDARELRDLAAERERRQQASQAYRQWRERDYQGPPPRAAVNHERKRDWQVWKRQEQQERRAEREQQRREQVWAQRNAQEKARQQRVWQQRSMQQRQQQVRQQQAQQEQKRKEQIWAQRQKQEKARQQRVWAERERQQQAQVRQARAQTTAGQTTARETTTSPPAAGSPGTGAATTATSAAGQAATAPS